MHRGNDCVRLRRWLSGSTGAELARVWALVSPGRQSGEERKPDSCLSQNVLGRDWPRAAGKPGRGLEIAIRQRGVELVRSSIKLPHGAASLWGGSD